MNIRKNIFIRPNVKLLVNYVNSGTKIRWVGSLGTIHDNNGNKELSMNTLFKGFTKNQNPIFEYTIKENECLIIRDLELDVIYMNSKKDDNFGELLIHPKCLKTIRNDRKDKNRRVS